MFRFGKRSEKNLETCHEDLQKVFREVIRYVDCAIICGHRGKEEQEQAFLEGRSKLRFPESKHNQLPSRAVDVLPYPVDWEDDRRFYYFAGFVMATAQSLGIELRYGGDWDGDYNLKDQNFFDLPHFELKGEKK